MYAIGCISTSLIPYSNLPTWHACAMLHTGAAKYVLLYHFVLMSVAGCADRAFMSEQDRAL